MLSQLSILNIHEMQLKLSEYRLGKLIIIKRVINYTTTASFDIAVSSATITLLTVLSTVQINNAGLKNWFVKTL